MAEGFDVVIGLEVHAQLATESKIFCGCSTRFGAEPNLHTCPVCLGLPGALPVLNRRAVEFAVKAGLAMNCSIAPFSKFDRKNYFYPDLPKGYQISQYDLPICQNGYLDVERDDGSEFRVRIKRIHLEEDAGKLIHGTGANIIESDAAFVDLNRAGTGLIEIVTEPDLHSPAEARAYLTLLKANLEYLGVSDCNMEEGSLRVDANLSVKSAGSEVLGTRTELKNMNSFRALERALEFEAERQAGVLRGGGRVVQETRTWDEKAGETRSLRSKEEAQDYRYFPEPDLVPVIVDAEWIERVRSEIGELPRAKKERFVREYGLPEYDAGVLTLDRVLAGFYEEVVRGYHDPKTVSNWVMGDFLRLVKETGLEYDAVRMTAAQLAAMLKLMDAGVISGKIAKTVFEEMFRTGREAEEIVKEQGLVQISDEGALEEICTQVLAANPQAIEDFRAGKERAVKFLMGQVMKESKGKANPQKVNEILLSKLSE